MAWFKKLLTKVVKSPFGKAMDIGVAAFVGVPDMENHINRNAAVGIVSKQVKVCCLSTMHAELIAIAQAIISANYVTDMRNEMGHTQSRSTIIFSDSQPAINFLKGDQAVPSQTSRHLRRRYDYIRQAVKRNEVRLVWVPTKLNCSDVLTKALARELFERHARISWATNS